MLDSSFLNQQNYAQQHSSARDQINSQAAELFWGAVFQGWLNKAKAMLTRKPIRLLDLDAQIKENMSLNRAYAGVRTVRVNQIRGTEGRSEDFDADFRPRRTYNRERWQSVARAALSSTGLPPVELIQVGETYYVRDGHHRISVARAAGQEEIEAEVTVWQTR